MRCLHSIDLLRLDQGGVVRAVLDLVGGLAQAGVEVTLLTGDDTDAPEAWRHAEPGLPRVVKVDQQFGLFGRSSATRQMLAKEVAAADVVHLHTPWDTFNPAVASEAKQHGKPYVVTMHGMLDDWCMAVKGLKKGVYLNLVARKILTQAARLHFTAAGERDQSMRRLGGGTPEVLPLLIDLSEYAEQPTPDAAHEAFPALFSDSSTESPRLLYLGRIAEIKGLDVLIDAAALLDKQGLKPKLLFAGPFFEEDYQRRLMKHAERVGVGERLHFLGMTHGEVKRSLYAACDMFVLPSHHENFGIALTEAMCSGAPVLTNRAVNTWPEVEKFGGVIVEDEAESLAQGLMHALGRLPQLREIAISNREAVLDWLNPTKLCAQYVEMYEQAIAEQQVGA